MRHRSTLLSSSLGGAALLSVAVACGAAVARYDTEAPRIDILVPLGLAAVFTGGWLVAVRAAAPVERLPAVGVRDGIAGTLAAVRRDWGLIATVYLTLWAPYAAARTAYSKGGSTFGILCCVLTLGIAIVLSPYAIGLLTNQLGAAQRMLAQDAAGGRVHAVRVRFGTPVRKEYRRPAGTGVGKIVTTMTYYAELLPEGGAGVQRTIPLHAMYTGDNFRIPLGGKHLSHAAAQLPGHTGWLCWPTRWKEIGATDKHHQVPAAFVADTGHVVWGHTVEEDWEFWLRGGNAPVRETDPGRAAEPLPRPSRFRPKAHVRPLTVAAVAAATAVPFLLGAVPYEAGVALGAVVAVLVLAAGVLTGSAADENLDPDLWTVRREEHPSLR
jgi:hypothetical protein